MSKKEFNTKNVGDEITLVYMKDEMPNMPLGEKGTITRVVDDPFDKDQKIIDVLWKNGSTLSLLSNIDLWYKEDEKLNEDDSVSVKPSGKVIKSVCDAKKFCSAQGPITFGQLKTLVNSAKNKRLAKHIGEGGFKAFIRLLPWFIPQIALAGFIGSGMRAANKLLSPTLKETSSYKTWWAKTITKLFNVAEGDLNTEDPLSRIFFISDGLMNLMNEENKLKFAYHISELADAMPDDQPVPEFFVENELRNWINQRFLLDPPLGPKTIDSFDDVNIDFDSEEEENNDELNESDSPFERYERLMPIMNSTNFKPTYIFLDKLRDSGVMNMFESIPFIWSGSDYLENYIRFKQLEVEDLDDLLRAADDSRLAMVGLTIEYLEFKGEEPTLENMNKVLKEVGRKVFEFFMMKYRG